MNPKKSGCGTRDLRERGCLAFAWYTEQELLFRPLVES